jgi:transcriptional regulator with XRE-family HTH domain
MKETETHNNAATEATMQKLRFSGAKLDSILKQRKWTVMAFAKLVGLHHETLYSYIRGESKPDADRLMDIAMYLGVRPHKIVKELFEEEIN